MDMTDMCDMHGHYSAWRWRDMHVWSAWRWMDMHDMHVWSA